MKLGERAQAFLNKWLRAQKVGGQKSAKMPRIELYGQYMGTWAIFGQVNFFFKNQILPPDVALTIFFVVALYIRYI